jgi:mycothiol system anti-sigma-R factor
MSDDCAKVIRELELYLDGETVDSVEALIARHLDECPPCLDRAEFERRLRAIIADKCTDCAPAYLHERIVIRLQSYT